MPEAPLFSRRTIQSIETKLASSVSFEASHTRLRHPDFANHRSFIDAIALENARITSSTSSDIIFKTVNGEFSLSDLLACDART